MNPKIKAYYVSAWALPCLRRAGVSATLDDTMPYGLRRLDARFRIYVYARRLIISTRVAGMMMRCEIQSERYSYEWYRLFDPHNPHQKGYKWTKK